jgi:hypothetical protein
VGRRIAVGRWPFPCPGFPGPASTRSSFRRSRSPSSRHLLFGGIRSACYPRRRRPKPAPSGVPLLEFLKDRPSTSVTACVHSRLPEVRSCHIRTCSALVVPPDFGGFLRTRLCRFVAPCSRSWGSPGFEPTADFRRRPTLLRGVPSPSKLSSGPAGLPVTRPPASSPLVRSSRSHRHLDLEAFFRSGVPHTACHHAACTSSLGFPRPKLSLKTPSPGAPTGCPGARRFPRRDCPVRAPAHRVSTRRPPCSARAPSRPTPGGVEPWCS